MDDISRMTLSALYDLLSTKTLSLLEAMNKKTEPKLIQSLKSEVQRIQLEIKRRRSSNLKQNYVLKFSRN